MHNDMIFGTGKETVMVSVKFLASYDETLNSIKRPGMQDLGDKAEEV
jgi:hypothetical protein